MKVFTSRKTQIALALVFFLIVLLLTPIFLSYSNALIINPSITNSVDNLVAQIPAIPKTPKQIIARSKQINQSLDSYKSKASLIVSAGDVKIINVSAEGSVRGLAEELTESTVHISGSSFFPSVINFDFQTLGSGSTLYLKVNKGVNLPGMDTTKLEKNWYQIDLEEFQKDIKLEGRDDAKIIEDIKKEVEIYLEKLRKDESVSSGATLTEVIQKNETYYQIKLKVKEDPLTKYFLSDTESKKTAILTLLINKKSFYLTKINLEVIQKIAGASETRLTFDYEISEQNQNLKIEKPKKSEKINNPVELYLLLNRGDQTTEVENLFKALGGEVKDSSANLLTIERLTRVVLLLPKAL